MRHKNLITYTMILLAFLIYSNCRAQSPLLFGGGWGANSLADSNSVFTPDFLTLILNGSSKYGYKSSPNDVDLNSANYIADSNSTFTGTVTSDYAANGNTSISFVADKMEVVKTSSTSSDYV